MDELDLLLGGGDPRALAAALRGQQTDALALQALTGGRRAAPQIGAALAGNAQHRQDQMGQVLLAKMRMAQQAQQQAAEAKHQQDVLGETRRYHDASVGVDRERLGLERSRTEQDAWGAVADPVTGGIMMFNKKTGETRPMGPGGGVPGQPAAGTPTGLPNLPGKPTEKQRNAVSDANQSMAQIDLAMKAIEENPGAYGGVANYASALADQIGGTPVQALTARRLGPGEVQAKNFVTNVVSEIINQRAGSNVTLREELRQKFLPSEMDSLSNAKQKLADLKVFEQTKYATQSGGALPAPGGPAAPRKTVKGKTYEKRPDGWYEVN